MARSRYKRKGKSKFIMIEGYIIRSQHGKPLLRTKKHPTSKSSGDLTDLTMAALALAAASWPRR